MFAPVYTYTSLASGLIMMSCSLYLYYKIYTGSKSTFAFVLMGFTFLDGAQNFAIFFVTAFMHPIYVNGHPYFSASQYALLTLNNCFYLMSLQSWIFGMKYLESAFTCCLTPPCISPLSVRILKWLGIFIYTTAIVVMWICEMATFPGYVNNNSFD